MTESEKTVPEALRFWFTLHFAADTIFAVPMFAFPVRFLNLLGWQTVDPIATRMVAAALFAIGIESLLSRKASADSFTTMLSLKIIWSSTALIGLTIALITGLFGNILVGITVLLIFLIFNILWTYWYIYMKKAP